MAGRGPLPARTPVLVVGAGPVGLTASVLLSQHGIPHVVVERRRELRRAPAAHVLRRRTMAVFRRIGIADAISSEAPPLALDAITWCTTLGGAVVGRLDLRAGLPPGREPWTHCPQNVLEPLLLARAQREPAACIVRGASCAIVGQDGTGVRALVHTGDSRAPNAQAETGSEIHADWVIAADGAGSPVRRSLGIPMVGPGPQGRFFMIHFDADLRPWLAGRSGPIVWLLNPESSGTLVVHDPARSHVLMTLQRGGEREEEQLPGRLAAALGVPAAPRILTVDRWAPHVQVAERYREGPIFLAGDAAHRFPPTGGLGLNTGIVEVEVLVAAIARIVGERASADELDAYGATCRPAALANARESFRNMLQLGEIARVLGRCPTLVALEERVASLSPTDAKRLEQAIEGQRRHFLFDGHLPQGATTSRA